MRNRDDFSAETKLLIAKRAGHRCSRCDIQTSGPQTDSTGAVNLGVAAHITAAALSGARFDSSLTPAQRAYISNAIWLCQNCAKFVDNDPRMFTVNSLHSMKAARELAAHGGLGKPPPPNPLHARLTAHQHEVWTIRGIGRRIRPRGSVGADFRETGECQIASIEDLTIAVVLINEANIRLTIPIADITLSYDDERYRQMIELRAK